MTVWVRARERTMGMCMYSAVCALWHVYTTVSPRRHRLAWDRRSDLEDWPARERRHIFSGGGYHGTVGPVAGVRRRLGVSLPWAHWQCQALRCLPCASASVIWKLVPHHPTAWQQRSRQAAPQQQAS